MMRQKEIVHAVVAIQGGKLLSNDDQQGISDRVHDTLAQDERLGKKYGRTGYSIVVEIAQDGSP